MTCQSNPAAGIAGITMRKLSYQGTCHTDFAMQISTAETAIVHVGQVVQNGGRKFMFAATICFGRVGLGVSRLQAQRRQDVD